jgi:hypothetical protein
MKQLLFTALFLWMAPIIYAQTQSTVGKTSPVMDQILETHKALYKALPEKSATVLESILRPEFVFTSANGDRQDRQSFLTGFALNAAVGIPLLQTSEQKIILVDNTAVLTALMHIHIIRNVNTDTTVRDLWERATETYVKQGGQWKLLSLQATYTKNE